MQMPSVVGKGFYPIQVTTDLVINKSTYIVPRLINFLKVPLAISLILLSSRSLWSMKMKRKARENHRKQKIGKLLKRACVTDRFAWN